MNDIGKKAAKANNLRRTHDLQVNEATDVMRGSPEARASEPHLRSVPNQVEQTIRESSLADYFSPDVSKVARRA